MPIFEAIESGDLQRVQTWIADGVDLDHTAVKPLTRVLDAAIAERRRQEEQCPDRDLLDRAYRDPRKPIELAFSKIRDLEACEPLIALMEDPRYRTAAINGLAGIGTPAFETLLDAVRRSQPLVKESLERALVRWVDLPSLDALIEVSGKSSALKALIYELDWTSPKDTKPVSDWVRSVGWPMAERFLSEIDNPDTWVRTRAIKLFGVLGDRRATALLIPLIRHEEYQVRVAALSSLRMLADPASIEALVGALDLEESDPVLFVLMAIGKEAVPALIDAASDERPVVRRNTLRALRKIRDERAFDIMLSLVDDPDLDVPREAIRGLQALADERAVSRLIEILYYHDLWREAAEALLAIGTYEAVKGIRAAMKAAEDPSFQNQLQALLDNFPMDQARQKRKG